MSYNILEDSESNLLEGLAFIQTHYPYYIKDKLEDPYSNIKYSVQMIQKSLSGIIDIEELYKIIIFDVLIGNSDRHHSNFAIISKGTVYKTPENMLDIYFDYKMCPLYDNGSSLCAYEDNNDIEIFFKDKMKFESLVNTKSKSAIGWGNERPIKHFDLLRKLRDNEYESTITYIEKIKNNVNEHSIDKILDEFSNEIINANMKRLLKMFLLERRNRMLDIYNIND